MVIPRFDFALQSQTTFSLSENFLHTPLSPFSKGETVIEILCTLNQAVGNNKVSAKHAQKPES